MDLISHIRRLFEYEVSCSALVIESLESARYVLEHGGGASEAAPWIRAVEVFAHIQGARQLWLARLGQISAPEDGIFPSWSFEKARKRCGRLDEAWAAYVGSLDAPGLDQVIDYRTTEGAAMSSSVVDILTHVVNHGSYHRGQIATLVAQCGGAPAESDYILFSRRGGGD